MYMTYVSFVMYNMYNKEEYNLKEIPAHIVQRFC
jgi:hypothetical protein